MASTTMTTSPTKLPLVDRSTNTHLSAIAATETSQDVGDNGTELKKVTNNSMEYHRQALKEELEEGKLNRAPGYYVSPSDGIMSPCTKKLSDLKGKKFKNVGKPQALFAKALAKKSFEKMSHEKSANHSSEMEMDDEQRS
ncbi:hypothetical protein VTO42DRAFT_5658 [Malbranchea cinnamomea]